MIAMAIANEPRLMIADEPTTALDVTVEAQILDLIDSLRRRLGAALVFISHDLKLVRRVADRVYVMREGAVVESGPSGAVLTRPTTAYARMLVEAEFSRERPTARADASSSCPRAGSPWNTAAGACSHARRRGERSTASTWT